MAQNWRVTKLKRQWQCWHQVLKDGLDHGKIDLFGSDGWKLGFL
jgi:hypothetical protein